MVIVAVERGHLVEGIGSSASVLVMSQMTVKKSDVTHGNWTTRVYGAMILAMLICNLILENFLLT